MSMKVNLLPQGKVKKWKINYLDKSVMADVVEELDTKQEVFMRLVDLQDDSDIDSIAVYPPDSNVTFEEFMDM